MADERVGNVVDAIIAEVAARCRADHDGALADYIPELAQVDPEGFALCIATSDGYVYETGDAATEFTIQSISKPFVYGLALADRGRAAVLDKIDVEPSGEPFNEISLDPVTSRPRNPMINAGAITATSLVAGDRFARIRDCFARYAGRALSLDESVYASEARTGDRNRAIAYLLRSSGIIDDAALDVVDAYFRQCSLRVTCRDLAVMAATLANNGRNPITRERALAPALVEQVLAVMTTCGMYDGSGDWVARVGLPAKSGVGGGILAVLPGQLGIAVYSPRLDAHGNSVRGVRACRELSRLLELHFLHVTRAGRSAIRATYDIAQAPSRLRRNGAEQVALEQFGHRARIYELHGDLLFAGAESVVRAVARDLDALVLDLRGVDEVGAVATRMLADLCADFTARGCRTAVIDPHRALGDGSIGDDGARRERTRAEHVFDSVETASQWAEEVILDKFCLVDRQPKAVALKDHPLLARLTPAQLRRLEPDLERRTYSTGAMIARQGTPAAGIFLILRGQVSTSVDGNRMATLSPGMSFGEMTLLIARNYLGDIVADTEVTVALLGPDRFAELSAQAPELKSALLERVAAGAYAQMEAAIRALRPRAFSA